MRRLLAIGARVRGIKNLHAKLYLFGASRAIVSSANLTAAALDRNQEFGAVLQDPVSIAACDAYVDRLWRLGDTDLLPPQVDAWDETVTSYLAAGGRANRAGGLGDFGADVGSLGRPIAPLPAVFANTDQAFVKFLGAANIREPLSSGTVDELRRAGCHWALAYPPSKRPVGINDGALMFIARMIKEPNDTRGLEFDALAGRPHGGDGRGMDSRGGVGRGRTTHGHKRVGSARRVRRAKTGWKRGCPHSAE